uniref:Tetracycline destructase Tet(51) n=2 Tax=uncultured bacterium TaxID=77133 RepID=A0ACD6B8T7_9BACT|nr:tetracycline destructase Tet(51) [uncultured bacterium]AKQ05895.1 tetracycline destructase Tet(51) [uncultured bacterium]
MPIINKILVIGAGIAGPAVCYWLRRFGFSPILVERCANLRKGGHAVDIRGVAIDLAKSMGIYKKICNMRTQVELGRYVDAEGNILHEEKGERFGFREGDDIEILRGDLVQILIDAMGDVPCHFNQWVESIKQRDNDVEVQFKDGRTELYDLVIGADGLHSTTRRMVFDKDEYKLTNLGAYFSAFSIPNYLNLNHTDVQFEANQKLISMASDKNPKIAITGFCFRAQNVLNNLRDENEQRRFLRDTFQDFGWETSKILELMSDSNDFYFDSFTQVKMKSWTKGRVALVGDAGYCASPFPGQGSNQALVGAYIFAGELKQAEGNYHRAFNRYNELLQPFVEANQKFGVLVNESFLVRDEVSKEVAEERSNKIMQEIKIVSNMISLPNYE